MSRTGATDPACVEALPLLFTFRRCPYAIRARLALAVAAQRYTACEVQLRHKPEALLQASPKGTVPVLVLPDGQVVDESLDIMLWALRRNDPAEWLAPSHGSLAEMLALAQALQSGFKPLLDRCKYPDRHPQFALADSRQQALTWLQGLEQRLAHTPCLFGQCPSLGDAAIFPFVRQFAAIDEIWWEVQAPPRLRQWRHAWLRNPLFLAVMAKPQAGTPDAQTHG